jgi:glycosyltransferase involved in cell wall biosynthesis
MISSIFAQTNPNWSIHVVADGNYDGFDAIANSFANHDKIRFSVIEGPNRDWGHSPRNYGIANAREEWLVMTGDDNYYFPNFVQEFLAVVDDSTNFIHCDFYNSHIRWDRHESKVEVNKIDIGNYATRTVYAKNMKLDTTKLNADGHFAVEYVQKYCNLPFVVKKIDRALYIHN